MEYPEVSRSVLEHLRNLVRLYEGQIFLTESARDWLDVFIVQLGNWLEQNEARGRPLVSLKELDNIAFAISDELMSLSDLEISEEKLSGVVFSNCRKPKTPICPVPLDE